MSTAITVIQVVLSLFAGGGLLKLATPYAKYVKLPAQGWANDFKPQHIRLIGVLEVCAGVGMIVPLLLGSLTMLAPLAAVGIALVMAGAMATHRVMGINFPLLSIFEHERIPIKILTNFGIVE